MNVGQHVNPVNGKTKTKKQKTNKHKKPQKTLPLFINKAKEERHPKSVKAQSGGEYSGLSQSHCRGQGMKSHFLVTITNCHLPQEVPSPQRSPTQAKGSVQDSSGTSGEAAIGGLFCEPHRTFSMALIKTIFDLKPLSDIGKK